MIKQIDGNTSIAVMGLGDLNVGMDVDDKDFGYLSIMDDERRIGIVFSDPMDAFEIAYYIQQIGKVMMKTKMGEPVNKEDYFKAFQQEVEGAIEEVQNG